MEEGKWYVVHTYSGYENKVKADLEKTIVNRNLQDSISEIAVPVEKVTELRDGKRKEVEKKLFPGYVLVKMVLNQETWYVVRNTRGVTSFVGPGSEPVPLTEEEIANMGIHGERRVMKVDFNIGDEVLVTSGAWQDTVGKIAAINEQKQSVTVMVDMFGRETPVTFGFNEVRRR